MESRNASCQVCVEKTVHYIKATSVNANPAVTIDWVERAPDDGVEGGGPEESWLSGELGEGARASALAISSLIPSTVWSLKGMQSKLANKLFDISSGYSYMCQALLLLSLMMKLKQSSPTK